ncbi:putative cysteine-rich receptor-like protein kinase 20 [Lolium rigidum]|uniref:putative cysteine-rich receptor-like protein kinase 20 n=1 Tax=Lolium rigidum TaxID=89674 RepID=UPI001F5DB9F8|nr:putative cysteine-rich receptor-like protein kinase 20 [Lolium rigidum]
MVVVLPCLFLVLVLSSPLGSTAAYSEYSCNATIGNYTASNAFGANLARLTSELAINASTSPSLYTCSSCLDDAFRQLRRLCAGDRNATFYHDLCTVRYSGENFLARTDDNRPVINAMDANGSTYADWDSRNATSRSSFLSLVGALFSEMALYAAYNSSVRRFASAVMYINPQMPLVYGLAQCTPDLSPGQCGQCFHGLGEQNKQWYDGREGGRILGVRCNFRYEGYHFYDGTANVRIGLPDHSPSPTGNGESKHKKILVIVLCASITVVFFMLVGCFLLIRRLRKGAGEMKLEQAESRSISKTEEALMLWKIEESGSEFTLYDFPELGAATDNFSEDNKLGTGGFGPGILPDGTEVAVKRLGAQSGQGFVEFKNEIQLIAKLQHTNLVKLLGCCVQEEEKMLVYEYMSNRSLDFFIFDEEQGRLLDWKRRHHIIEGIAQGLLYLHKHSRVRIIHRDMKASNILLDQSLNPKISDFGMARIFGSNVTQANTNRIVGTYGYMAPEYASEGIFSDKSDVFSFGVLLLEIVSGKRNSGHGQHHGNFVNLLGYAWQLWREGRGFELVDRKPSDFDEVTSILRCIKVALLCVQDNAMDRPTMTDVTTMLGNLGVRLPDPRQPPHFQLRVARVEEEDVLGGSGARATSTHFTDSCSTNDMTISTIKEGR